MPTFCCVANCKKQYYPGCGVSFHRLPKDPFLAEEWKHTIPGSVTKYSIVCNDHFKEEDFLDQYKRKLKSTAVPSIFPKKSRRPLNTASLLILVLQLFAHVSSTQFASHVSVNTPARSFTHGVGDPLPPRRGYHGFKSSRRPPLRQTYRPTQRTQQRFGGYPRVKPVIPFNSEEIAGNGLNSLTWPYDSQIETSIPVLPPSPYRVDSPDPESLWPEGLFLPPVASRFGHFGRRTDSDSDINDPYLLEGSEAIAAVKRARDHGVYYFHDIPHIESLFANQELRIQNDLKPHRIASIRQTWPYNRP